MACGSYFRIRLTFKILNEKQNGLKADFKMIEESLLDSDCFVKPAYEEKFENKLLTVIPVHIYLNRSTQTSPNSDLSVKVEKRSSGLLKVLFIDCLVPANSAITDFCSEDKNNCISAILSQLKLFEAKWLQNPEAVLYPRHLATSSEIFTLISDKGIGGSSLLSEAHLQAKYKANSDKRQDLVYGNILSDIWEEKPGNHLINPHSGIAPPEPIITVEPAVMGKSALVEIALVSGYYRYFRYNEDGFSDSGWGCAYRSLQTVCSWFLMQGYVDKPEPDHRTIQQILVKIGDKPKSFFGSSQWIGSFEVSYVLENYLDIKSRILNVSSGDELESMASQLIQHFRIEGTPIMIGGGNLAHTIIGVYLNRATGMVKYLILDPHYSGAHKATVEDEIKTVTSKGYVGWKENNFWKKGSFHNLCLPERPKIET